MRERDRGGGVSKRAPVVCVVAGNHGQYEDFLRFNGLSKKDAKYISDADDMRGWIPGKLVLVGTYNRSSRVLLDPYFMEWCERIRIAGGTIVYVDV